MFVLMTTCTKPVISTLLKAAVIVAATLLLYTNHVQAEGPYPWSDQPEYQRTPGDYSQGSDRGYRDYYGRGPEEIDRDRIERNRQAYIDEQRRQSAAPAKPRADQEQYSVQGPNGRYVICMPQLGGNVICN
jgi:hypothetical protein